MKSLSARRAWIEIRCSCCSARLLAVALRKESVDRNKYVVQCRKTLGVSLSARRAWIEIPAGCWRDARRASLSARRAWIEIGRHGHLEFLCASLSARRAWIEIDGISWHIHGFLRRSPQGERG